MRRPVRGAAEESAAHADLDLPRPSPFAKERRLPGESAGFAMGSSDALPASD